MIDYKPEEDGVTHVNVYSKSRCLLGRLLSNFAHIPFEIDGRKFESVESWWYYSKMININSDALFPLFTDEQINEISGLIGKEAKKRFRELYKEDSQQFSPKQDSLRKVYLLKAQAHEELRELLVKNELPLVHYYMMFDKKVSADDTLWTAELWNEIKQELIQNNMSKRNNENRIYINSWDDFYEDGYVPEGKKQETFIYVECEKEKDHDFEKEVLEKLLDKILDIHKRDNILEGVTFEVKFHDSRALKPELIGTEYEWCLYQRWEVRIEYMTHSQLHKLLEILEKEKLSHRDREFYIYSES